MWNADYAEQVYRTYLVDLLRTAGVLLQTSPYVIYKASVLLQRFESSVEQLHRRRYLPSKGNFSAVSLPQLLHKLQETAQFPSRDGRSIETDADVVEDLVELYRPPASPPGVAVSTKTEYCIPDHVDTPMASRLAPLADLFAPVDLCLDRIILQEDVSFVAAACLLIASKLSSAPIHQQKLVRVFFRLSQRRVDMQPMDMAPERYTDFEACVLEAEEVVLHTLGFHAGVASPYTYLHVYLHTLVQAPEPSGAEGQGGDSTSTSNNEVAAEMLAKRKHFVDWLVRAVEWINDAPRCGPLVLQESASVIAVAALSATKPGDDILCLPQQWTLAFGADPAHVARVVRMQQQHLYFPVSSKRLLMAVRAAMPKPYYRKQKERDEAERAEEEARQRAAESAAAAALAEKLLAEEKAKQQQEQQKQQQAALSSVEDLEAQMHFEDLGEVLKRRRQREKEEREKERQRKAEKRARERSRSRSDEKRKHHRSEKDRKEDRHRHSSGRDHHHRHHDDRHSKDKSKSKSSHHSRGDRR